VTTPQRYVVGRAVITQRDGEWLVIGPGSAAYGFGQDRAAAWAFARTL
jgi:hypothetical protein